MKYNMSFLCLATALVLSSSLFAAGITLSRDKGKIDVKIGGKLFTRYHIGQSNKPFFWPVIGPNGEEMTRAYPVEKREGERHDHPHHRSLWFGHQGIAGFDTWHEPLSGRRTKLGATVHREFVKVQGGDTAVIVTRNDYTGGGKKLLADLRTHTFRVAKGQRVIDVDITFTAEHGDCRMADIKDAGFSVRVATSMDVDSKKGGRLINSHGVTDREAWGKRAPWVDYHGPVNGKTVGIAMLNHPTSFRHPTPWHVRTYGLFTANPFGIRSLRQGKDSSFTLKKGESIKLRHRIILHNGNEKAANVAAAYEAYAKEK